MATPQKTLEQYPIKDRWTDEVLFTAQIDVTPDMLPSVKLGLAVKWGVKEKKSLARANLARADLARASLARANLAGANLVGADLARANLARANLASASLVGANLASASLVGADLASANLAGANLVGASLARANLAGANLVGASLAGAKNLTLPHFQLPEGDLIGWKALRGGIICKLRIPPEAKRTASIIGRKCRAEFVEVLEGEGYDKHSGTIYYKPGETIRPDSYDDNPLIECTHGIHFFATKAEAEEWL